MEPSGRNAIGENLRRIRSAKKLSQQRLSIECARLGYDFPRGTLAKVEAGIRAVSDIELFVLSHVLKVELSELFPDDLLKRIGSGEIQPFHIRSIKE